MVNSGDINGIPVHADPKILTDLLRKELGFTGVTDSDWEDIIRLYRIHRVATNNKEAVREAVMAGIDMSMVPNDWSFTDDLLALVKEGAVPMSRIDEAVRRILRMKIELGRVREHAARSGDDRQHRRAGVPGGEPRSGGRSDHAAQERARPAAAREVRRRCSSPARRPTIVPSQYGGWSYTWQGTEEAMYPKNVKTLLDAVRDQVGAANVKYVPGSKLTDTLDVAAAVAAARGCRRRDRRARRGRVRRDAGQHRRPHAAAAQLRLARAIEATGVPVVLALYHGRPRILRDAVDGARADRHRLRDRPLRRRGAGRACCSAT